jgi:uncharacterized membrane protein
MFNFKPYLALLAALILALSGSAGARAATPVAHAILFYSPTCPHCHVVIDDVLPPLQEQYGAQLNIAMIDVSSPAGQQIYQNAITSLAISADRYGVPALVIDTTVLVGSIEIPTHLPALIAQTLAAGGNTWPAIPGFSPAAAATMAAPPQNLFQRDPLNSVAISVLLAMLVSVVLLAPHVRRFFAPPIAGWRSRAIPLIALAGMAVAAYLAYVEVSGAPAVCGPIGDCNTVQQSPYARLFGILPIGVLGVIGYTAILAAWAGQQFGSGALAHWSARALPLGALAGTLFSIYLTFLEPFVIGASCIWCLSSAVLITTMLWISLPRRAAPVRRGKLRPKPARS